MMLNIKFNIINSTIKISKNMIILFISDQLENKFY